MHKLDEYPEDRIQLLPFVSLSTFLYDVLRKWSGAIAEMLAAGRHVLDAGLHDRDALQCGDSVYSGHWSWKHHRWGCRRRLAKNQGPQKTIMSEYEYMYRLCTLSTKFRRYVFFLNTPGKTQSCCLDTIPSQCLEAACKLSVMLRKNSIEEVTFLDSRAWTWTYTAAGNVQFSEYFDVHFVRHGEQLEFDEICPPLWREPWHFVTMLAMACTCKKAPVFGDDGFPSIGTWLEFIIRCIYAYTIYIALYIIMYISIIIISIIILYL